MANRDLSFEALAKATATDWNTGRGELNASLASIRVQMEGVEDDLLATEILHRARLYRQVFPEMVLTPTALAKHWLRVFEEVQQTQATNQTAPVSGCETCGGHRFVLVNMRPAVQTIWMREHGIKEREEGDALEEYAPCPDCHTSADTSYRLMDGRPFQIMDPATVRVRIKQ